MTARTSTPPPTIIPPDDAAVGHRAGAQQWAAEAPAAINSLAGKTAVVTGAASGIGRAVAIRLQGAGMNVLAVDVSPDPDGPGIAHHADLTIAAALERFGQLDVVVANAGIQHVAPIDEFPVERWQTINALMLTSPFLLAKHGWPALRESSVGKFIAIASVHGLVASPFKAAYVSAKHGLVGLVKSRRSRSRAPAMESRPLQYAQGT